MKRKPTGIGCPHLKAGALLCALVFALTPLAACDGGSPRPAPPEMTPIKPGPGEIHTGTLGKDTSRPMVKLRKNKDGTYSWEIKGDDVDAILDADKRLKEHAGNSKNNSTD